MTPKREVELFDSRKLWKLVDIIFHGEHSAQAYLDVEAFIQSEISRNRLEAVREFADRVRLPKQDFTPIFEANKHFTNGYNRAYEDQDQKITAALSDMEARGNGSELAKLDEGGMG